MRHASVLLTGALAIVAAVACTAPSPPRSASPPAQSPSPATAVPATAVPVTAGSTPAGSVTAPDQDSCAVTRPRPFEPPPGVSYGALFGADTGHGNAQLWVGGLGLNGAIVVSPNPDGSRSMKYGWYRIAPGRLTITGRRLDAPAPPARGSVPDGYGDTGFQSSAVTFPTPGCWQITGTVGASASLTFVTFVHVT